MISWTVCYSKQHGTFQQIDLFPSSGRKALRQFGDVIQNRRCYVEPCSYILILNRTKIQHVKTS